MRVVRQADEKKLPVRPTKWGWMVGEGAKRHMNASIAGGVESFCALTDHLEPFLPYERDSTPLAVEKKQRHENVEHGA